jgi:PqqD family protein of HPr-rel-A system
VPNPARDAIESSTEPAWLAAPGADLAWRRIGDEYVVYHRPSGKTHFLNPPSAHLLLDLLRQPRTAAAAAAALAAAETAEAGEEYRAAVTRLLFRLEELGLVERAPA